MDVTVDQVLAVFNPCDGVDSIWLGPGVIYSQRLSALRPKSRLGAIVGTPVYKSMTIRSWSTAVKLPKPGCILSLVMFILPMRRRVNNQSRLRLLAVIGVIAACGMLSAVMTRAATFSLPVEAESGAIIGVAALVEGMGASDGQAVRFGAATVAGNALYVAPQGNDNSTGSQDSPFKTISRALSVVKAGQTVYVRAGVYSTANLVIATKGTAGSRVTISSYPGERAILDATGGNLSETGSIVDIKGEYVTFDGFELRNSSGRAITMTGKGNVVSNNVLHDLRTNGLVDAGMNNLIVGNEVYNAVLQNKDNAMGEGGWAVSMNSYFSTNTTFRDNYVHDNWGEGIDFIQSNGGLAEGNRVVDTFSVLIYVDGSDGVIIRNNHLASTKTIYDRPGGKAFAVLLADESGGTSLSNLTITGNKMYNTRGISTWGVQLVNLIESGNTTCTTLACAMN